MYILLFLIIVLLIINYYPYHHLKYINFDQLDLKDTVSLFWTGGYDSTFRLCQLLIDEKKIVQPIYVMCKNIDSTNRDFFSDRQSREKEITIMQKIRYRLFKDYPYIQKLLKPLLIVNKVRENPIADAKARYIHYELKQYARPYTQYERLARFSLYYPTTIEIGLDKCGTGLDKATNKFRTGIGSVCRIMDNLPNKYKALDVYDKFRFSIVHLSKKDMLEISRKKGYKNILKMTWSCWFPKFDGNPCGECQMCRLRIVRQGF